MADEHKNEKGYTDEISRREFLKDAGLVVGGATLGSVTLLGSCGKTATETTTKTISGSGATTTVTVMGPTNLATVIKTDNTGTASATGLMPINLTVNGREHSVVTKAHWPLRDVLREQVGMTSIKDMCSGYGACGSCCVILNGRPVLSCMTLACECDGAVIMTAEGMANAKDPLVDAYVVNHCMQCGFCTPGFIVTARALLDKNSKPTSADIAEALSGNLCRCDTYTAHLAAILEVAGAK
jgi:aerobic-type carbon monoxide dehydrogenase small subunit (CoxS/CutS family)